jgi:hypothetical protein
MSELKNADGERFDRADIVTYILLGEFALNK